MLRQASGFLVLPASRARPRLRGSSLRETIKDRYASSRRHPAAVPVAVPRDAGSEERYLSGTESGLTSIAAVASLIFVGIQVHQNGKMLERARARDVARHNQATLRAMADHADVASDGFDRFDEMGPADAWRFDMVWSMWFQGP